MIASCTYKNYCYIDLFLMRNKKECPGVILAGKICYPRLYDPRFWQKVVVSNKLRSENYKMKITKWHTYQFQALSITLLTNSEDIFTAGVCLLCELIHWKRAIESCPCMSVSTIFHWSLKDFVKVSYNSIDIHYFLELNDHIPVVLKTSGRPSIVCVL